MYIKLFSIYTALGGGLWTLILLALGYFIGDNKALVLQLMPLLKIGFVIGVAAVGFYYWKKHKKSSAA